VTVKSRVRPAWPSIRGVAPGIVRGGMDFVTFVIEIANPELSRVKIPASASGPVLSIRSPAGFTRLCARRDYDVVLGRSELSLQTYIQRF